MATIAQLKKSLAKAEADAERKKKLAAAKAEVARLSRGTKRKKG